MTVERISTGSAIALSAAASVVSALPSFLVSGFAIFMLESVGLGPAELGTATAAFYLGSTLVSIPGGRLTRRIGPRKSLILAASMTLIALVGVGGGVRSVPTLLAVMAFAGTANGIGQVASNIALAGSVAPQRQGLAFGLKQTSAPLSTLISGATIPLVALTIGWRWGFFLAALGALGLIFGLIRAPGLQGPEERRLSSGGPSSAPSAVASAAGAKTISTAESSASRLLHKPAQALAPILFIAVGVACAAAVGMSIVSFYVFSVVSGGVPPSTAGYLLMMGSMSGIIARTVLGWSADRRQRGQLTSVSLLLSFGAVGCFALSMAPSSTIMLLFGTILGFACGWGWPGLFFYAITRVDDGSATRALAITQTGMFLGALIGPFAFGYTVALNSFETAWNGAALIAILGATLISFGARRLPQPS